MSEQGTFGSGGQLQPKDVRDQQAIELEEGKRNVWIFTGYAIVILLLLGVGAFYISEFVAR